MAFGLKLFSPSGSTWMDTSTHGLQYFEEFTASHFGPAGAGTKEYPELNYFTSFSATVSSEVSGTLYTRSIQSNSEKELSLRLKGVTETNGSISGATTDIVLDSVVGFNSTGRLFFGNDKDIFFDYTSVNSGTKTFTGPSKTFATTIPTNTYTTNNIPVLSWKTESDGSGGASLVGNTDDTTTVDLGVSGNLGAAGGGGAGGPGISVPLVTISGHGQTGGVGYITWLPSAIATSRSVGQVSGGNSYFSGGGGGAAFSNASFNGGTGGLGGGANGANGSLNNGNSATIYTGGGAGGATGSQSTTRTGGTGGKGIVIIRYSNSGDVLQTVATGGDHTDIDGGYTYHTFKNNGTFTVTTVGSEDIEVLLVAGGGGGGGGYQGCGGGGAGGLIQTFIPSQTTSVVVGSGGASNFNGSDSTAFGLTAIGGGCGGANDSTGIPESRRHGGSGGGGHGAGPNSGTPSTSVPGDHIQGKGTDSQGFNGGSGSFGVGNVLTEGNPEEEIPPNSRIIIMAS